MLWIVLRRELLNGCELRSLEGCRCELRSWEHKNRGLERIEGRLISGCLQAVCLEGVRLVGGRVESCRILRSVRSEDVLLGRSDVALGAASLVDLLLSHLLLQALSVLALHLCFLLLLFVRSLKHKSGGLLLL